MHSLIMVLWAVFLIMVSGFLAVESIQYDSFGFDGIARRFILAGLSIFILFRATVVLAEVYISSIS